MNAYKVTLSAREAFALMKKKRGPREGNPHTVTACQLKILKGTETAVLLWGKYCL